LLLSDAEKATLAEIGQRLVGEKDRALGWVERAYEERVPELVYMKTYPGWDALRSEPRFQALVRRMNFP